jgi:hypothetical protein
MVPIIKTIDNVNWHTMRIFLNFGLFEAVFKEPFNILAGLKEDRNNAG